MRRITRRKWFKRRFFVKSVEKGRKGKEFQRSERGIEQSLPEKEKSWGKKQTLRTKYAETVEFGQFFKIWEGVPGGLKIWATVKVRDAQEKEKEFRRVQKQSKIKFRSTVY